MIGYNINNYVDNKKYDDDDIIPSSYTKNGDGIYNEIRLVKTQNEQPSLVKDVNIGNPCTVQTIVNSLENNNFMIKQFIYTDDTVWYRIGDFDNDNWNPSINMTIGDNEPITISVFLSNAKTDIPSITVKFFEDYLYLILWESNKGTKNNANAQAVNKYFTMLFNKTGYSTSNIRYFTNEIPITSADKSSIKYIDNRNNTFRITIPPKKFIAVYFWDSNRPPVIYKYNANNPVITLPAGVFAIFLGKDIFIMDKNVFDYTVGIQTIDATGNAIIKIEEENNEKNIENIITGQIAGKKKLI